MSNIKHRIGLGNCKAGINENILPEVITDGSITWDSTIITWDNTIITLDQE